MHTADSIVPAVAITTPARNVAVNHAIVLPNSMRGAGTNNAAPGTGTPEPAGMSSNQVMSLLEGMAPWPFVGMDCVEVAPAYDHAELTSTAAATAVWTYLCGRIRGPQAPSN